MSLVWYPFFVGDYQRKTAHLSLLEHGAYHLLIDHYMATCHPLPKEPAKLYRICRATSPTERKSVMRIIEEFFVLDGEYYINKKCDSEIANQLKKSESQSAKAKLRHHSGISPEPAESMPRARVTTTTPTIDKEKEERPSKKKVVAYSSEFEIFWSAYPRKDGSKSEAFKNYQKSVDMVVTPEMILAGALAYKAQITSEKTESRYIAHASAWLHQRRWEAEYRLEKDDKQKPMGETLYRPGQGYGLKVN